jgi:hypothetical protein
MTLSVDSSAGRIVFDRGRGAAQLGHAAQRAGSATTLLTFDVRQARAARQIGIDVTGT